jgi:hypothetical protein
VQEEVDASFQDADSRFVYVDEPSVATSDSSAGLPPVATAFYSSLSPRSRHQDPKPAATEPRCTPSSAPQTKNNNHNPPAGTRRQNGVPIAEGVERVGSLRDLELPPADLALNSTSPASRSADVMRVHSMHASAGNAWDAGMRSGSWAATSRSWSTHPAMASGARRQPDAEATQRHINGHRQAPFTTIRPQKSELEDCSRCSRGMVPQHGGGASRAVAEGLVSEEDPFESGPGCTCRGQRHARHIHPEESQGASNESSALTEGGMCGDSLRSMQGHIRESGEAFGGAGLQTSGWEISRSTMHSQDGSVS